MATAALPMTRMEVPDREPAAPVTPPADPKAPTLEQRLESMERELNETKESARVWEGIANSHTPAPATRTADEPKRSVIEDFDFGEDPDDEDKPLEGDTPEAMLDEMSKLGTDALAKRGFVRKADVIKLVREESRKAAATAATQAVSRARREVTTESQIMQDFPELSDQTSELFKITSENVRAAIRLDPSAAKNPATLYLAAKAAKAELGGARQVRGKAREEDDEDPEPRRTSTRNQDRDDRVAAQHGDRGRSRSRIETNSDEDTTLNADALDLISKLGIDPKDYQKNAAATRSASQRRR